MTTPGLIVCNPLCCSQRISASFEVQLEVLWTPVINVENKTSDIKDKKSMVSLALGMHLVNGTAPLKTGTAAFH